MASGQARNQDTGRRLGVGALRLAPWVMFGPITGLLSEVAFRLWRGGRPALAGACVALNVAILLAIPTLTALLAARL